MKNYLLILGLLSFSNFTYAEGGMASGGGDAIVCQTSAGAKTAKLLDFYEGEYIFGDLLNKLRSSQLKYGEILESALRRMDKTSYGYLNTLTKLDGFKPKSLRDMVKHIQKKKRIIKNYSNWSA